jgi:hypothetical protein
MEQLGEALAAFIRFQLRADNWAAYVIFVISSGVIGLAVVMLDLCSVALGRESVLDLTHGPKATPKAAVVWMVGSMLGASLGLLARVFEPTPLAAVLASLTWRTLLAQLQRLSSHSGERPPKGE